MVALESHLKLWPFNHMTDFEHGHENLITFK
jgi:hypothetical protein